MNDLMTTAEVALAWRVSARFVQRESQAGRLRCIVYRSGGRSMLRYRVEDVQAWIARYAHERGPGSEGP